ncbi:ABC transporter permease [Parapedobacter koreensis]|uniref:Putative ABC transport system permease protein n=1 Tax=Parapedobacter koreensis TaxID=332977 RepID=A0A1H7R2S1_9SPHI|nr:ABC transporter permease [Parapedobacter koreensis]SEL53857.1 putative ABC transport system permease protein [Parapedobacter koreensis]
MFRNYLTIAFRGLVKNKLHTAINVSGLALGIACVFLIAMYVAYERGYDRYYDHYENLYRITWENENPQTRTPHPMAQAVVRDFPEVESAVSLSPLWGAGLTKRTFSVRNLEKNIKFDETSLLAVDTTFFDVFRFPVVRGDAKRALMHVNGLLISESFAKKYFGDEDPIGKQLAVNADTVLLEVMAVFKDVPEQSHFHFDLLISYLREKSFNPESNYYKWGDFGHFNYLRLKPGTSPKVLEGKLLSWVRQYINISDEQYQKARASNFGFRLQPLTDIHLKSHLRWELETNGNIEYVHIMVAAGLLTLVIACINFMNLMVAKSAERTKEIGIRKTVGALRSQLSFQFIGESLFIALISVIVAILLVMISLPFYNSLTGHSFRVDYLKAVPMLVGLGAMVGIISGLYPSLFLSSAQPNAILKGNFRHTSKGSSVQKALIVFQFTVSIVLISGATIIFNQLDYIQRKNLGFDKEEMVVIPLKDRSVGNRMETLKTTLMNIEGVTSVSASSNLPGGQFDQRPVSLNGSPGHEIDCSEAFVDYDFLKTMNIGLAEGRFFRRENLSDTMRSFVINETAALQLNAQLQLPSVVGQEINWLIDQSGNLLKGRIVGIMKDFHFQSFHRPVQPLLFILSAAAYNHLVIKLNTTGFENRIAAIKQVYTQFDDAYDFEFAFLDERLDQQYKSEQRTGVVFGLFAFIAIVIACIGLFGMTLIAFYRRTKEIGIRKVLGASVPRLITLLLGDFTKLILLAMLIAIPVAWWMMDRWLYNFAYHIELKWFTFALSGLVAVAIAILTISFQAIKAAVANPVESLRDE